MPDFASEFVTTADGVRLHTRCYGRPSNATLPVICLAGLTRNAADFDALATALAGDAQHPRRVLALDYRGRGESGYDPNPANYNLPTELGDVLTVATTLKALPAVFVGTSRGGLLTMLLGVVQPAAIAGAVLNDIGPAVETAGLMRIKGYVGKLPKARTFEEAAATIQHLFASQFPALTAADWLAYAKRTFTLKNGALLPNYDINLAKSLDGVNFDKLPLLWNEFDAFPPVPLMVIRGANSDVLSASTVDAMRVRRPTMETVVVQDQGHAPLLAEPDTVGRIVDFVVRCDSDSRSRAAQ
jgi:pimeloyl-ACP methyl ester carboxylesterase